MSRHREPDHEPRHACPTCHADQWGVHCDTFAHLETGRFDGYLLDQQRPLGAHHRDRDADDAAPFWKDTRGEHDPTL